MLQNFCDISSRECVKIAEKVLIDSFPQNTTKGSGRNRAVINHLLYDATIVEVTSEIESLPNPVYGCYEVYKLVMRRIDPLVGNYFFYVNKYLIPML